MRSGICKYRWVGGGMTNLGRSGMWHRGGGKGTLWRQDWGGHGEGGNRRAGVLLSELGFGDL